MEEDERLSLWGSESTRELQCTAQSRELTRQRNLYTAPAYSFKYPAEWYRLISRPLARFLADIRIKVETTDEHPQGASVTSNEACVSVCGPDSVIKGLA